MPRKIKKIRRPNMVSGEGYCRKCQKTKILDKFYETTNPLLDSNGYMSICKDCCNELYHMYFSIYNNMETALKLTCRDLDVRFSKDALKQTQSHIEGLLSKGKTADIVFGYYKSKLMSTGKYNEKIEDFRYKDSDFFEENNIVIDVKDVPVSSDFELTEEILKFWGKIDGFTVTDYEYLVNQYEEYINTYECETPVMRELLKQASLESLEIRRKRMIGENVNQNLKNLQSILGDANIKPVQETGANATEQTTFGLLIKKWENEEPIPEPDEEWKDVDGIGKYIRVWFLGHLCKILGITNEYSEEYEQEMAKLRVELPSDSSLIDELEEGG